MNDLILGIDVSDATARLAVVNSGGEILERGISTPNRVTAITDAVAKVTSSAGGHIASVAVALSSPGATLPDEMRAALEAATKGIPITAIAAGTASAIAEFRCGAAIGARQVITFSIADHVKAGILIDGKPWLGSHGLASSIGWFSLNPVEREDYRRYGGLEAEVSSTGIVRRFVWRIKSGDTSEVADKAKGDFTQITSADIFQGARSGDGVSISVVRDTARYIAMAVANMAAMFDPDVIVLGGVIASSGDVLLETIRVELARRLLPQQAEQIKVVPSVLGDDAVAIGAALASSRAGA